MINKKMVNQSKISYLFASNRVITYMYTHTHAHTHARTHAHTHTFNGPFPGLPAVEPVPER